MLDCGPMGREGNGISGGCAVRLEEESAVAHCSWIDDKTSRYRKRIARSSKEDDQCDVMVGNEIQGSDEESISSKPPDHPTREDS